VESTTQDSGLGQGLVVSSEPMSAENSVNIVNSSLTTKIVYVNVQCLRTKLNMVQTFVCENEPHILCISEHWLSEEEWSFYKEIGSLRLVSIQCRTTHIHGGVAIYARTDLAVEPLDLKGFSVEFDLEVVGLKLYNSKDARYYAVVSAYRSDNGRFDNFMSLLYNCLTFLVKYYPDAKLFIGGDFQHSAKLRHTSSKTTHRSYEKLWTLLDVSQPY